MIKISYFLTACLAIFSQLTFAQERIISIGGDVSEIIYALNAEQHLVGRDSTSTIPEKIKALPDVGYMRQLNIEGLLALKPTKVITTQVAQPAIIFEQLKSAGVSVETVPLKYTTESVLQKIRLIGNYMGKEVEAEKLATQFQQQMDAVPNSPLDVKILFVMNRAGTNQMVAGSGTVADSAIQLIGAKNAMAGSVRFTPISQEGVIAANPDVIVISKLGLEGLGSPDKLWEIAGLSHTNAGKHKRMVVVDDIAFLAFGLTIPQELQKMRQVAEQAVEK
ncbi:hemin ABC transporter substrate-binding protein [Pasteurellaceae bacterium Macca]|nr:hemin ABC transporter substrate-binding protein [Pasteurellaceae bacterium Macca]